jgi:hypothetical protein
MDDGVLIDNEDFRSTRMRAREVRARCSLARNAVGASLECRGEAADLGAERGAGVVGHAGLPDAWHQQRPALHLASAVSHRRVDRVCAGNGVTGGWRASGGFCAP